MNRIWLNYRRKEDFHNKHNKKVVYRQSSFDDNLPYETEMMKNDKLKNE